MLKRMHGAAQPGGGIVAAVGGGMLWPAVDTELQLSCGAICLDRYRLSAAEIRGFLHHP